MSLPLTKAEFRETHIVHSYVRCGFSDDKTKMKWKCDDPLCDHYIFIPTNNRKELIGKMTLCPSCKKQQFVLTSEDVRRARPICQNCKNPERQENIEKGKAAMEGLFGSTL